ncbi:MAG: hypothetical protein ACI4KL_06670 [Lentihominibacter sp.]
MDTIKLSVDGHDISFTTKSLTIDDKVYLYTGISAIKHSSAKKLYLFKYEDSWHKLPYEEKDQKKVAAIFRRVAEMNAKRSAKAEGRTSLAKVMEDNAGLVETETGNRTDADTVTDTVTDPVAADSEAADKASEDNTAEVSEADALPEAEMQPEADAQPEAEVQPEAEELTEGELRKKRLIKAFAVLAVIIVLFVLAGVAYFFVFGTSNDASQSPNTDSTHEYNDIDELIDEMNK